MTSEKEGQETPSTTSSSPHRYQHAWSFGEEAKEYLEEEANASSRYRHAWSFEAEEEEDDDDEVSLGSPTEAGESFPSNNNDYSDVLKRVLHLLSQRQCMAVASGSALSLIQRNPLLPIDVFVRHQKQRVELEIAILMTEEAILTLLTTQLSHTEVIVTLFRLMDVDRSGGVDVFELAQALGQLRNLKAIQDAMPLAEQLISEFAVKESASQESFRDNDGHLYLNCGCFSKFITALSRSMDCSFSELASFMVDKIAFSRTGRELLEQSVDIILMAENAHNQNANDHHQHQKQEEQKTTTTSNIEFKEAIVQARLVMLFEALDKDCTGTICFREIVKHLFRFSRVELHDAKRKILLMVDKDSHRFLHLEEFAEFMVNIFHVFPSHISSHEILNAMTLSLHRKDVTDAELEELMAHHECFDAVVLNDEEINPCSATYHKVCRVFEMWDLDHSNRLSNEEFTLGLRKFHRAKKSLHESMQEGLQLLMVADQNQDGQLSKAEFIDLIFKFAKAMGVKADAFVDFLCVQTALRDNKKEEREYMESLQQIKKSEQIQEKRHGGGARRSTRRSTTTGGRQKRRSSASKLSFGKVFASRSIKVVVDT